MNRGPRASSSSSSPSSAGRKIGQHVSGEQGKKQNYRQFKQNGNKPKRLDALARRQQQQRQQQQTRYRKQKQVLVFDQKERVNFVKGFEKRKQERREKAKQEAIGKEREVRKLLRQKRREAMNRSQSAPVVAHSEEEEAEEEEDGGGEAESDGYSAATAAADCVEAKKD